VYLKLGRPLAAAETLKTAIAAAPRGWINLGAARAELQSAGGF